MNTPKTSVGGWNNGMVYLWTRQGVYVSFFCFSRIGDCAYRYVWERCERVKEVYWNELIFFHHFLLDACNDNLSISSGVGCALFTSNNIHVMVFMSYQFRTFLIYFENENSTSMLWCFLPLGYLFYEITLMKGQLVLLHRLPRKGAVYRKLWRT